MSLSKTSKTGAGQLPKSVKVRSTCNACQQAKIRCSHEKPSCRRCQKHKIDCVYSVSRRLGRPAKKKEGRANVDEGGSGCPTPEDFDRPERHKKRKPAKKKSQVLASCRAPAVRTPAKSGGEDRAQIPISDVGTEVPGMCIAFVGVNNRGLICTPGLEADISSEGWLQELISTHVSGNQGALPVDLPYADVDLDDTLEICPNEVAYMGPPFCLQPADIYPNWIPVGAETMFERDLGLFSSATLQDQLEPQIVKEQEPAPWMCAQSPMVDAELLTDTWQMDRVPSVNILLDPTGQYEPFQSPRASHDRSSYSPEDAGILPTMEEAPIFSCGCYKQTVGELVQACLKGPSSIDEILNCQKELLLQTEAILHCRMCSQSEAQANLLMVNVVAMDSLLATIDSTAIIANSCVNEGVVSGAGGKSELGYSFKSQIDACPLFVGGLRVPAEEQASFIRQVMQARLSMMLTTVRQIRVCIQQHLTVTSSRGRLSMIVETERRLQLTIMRIKMSGG